ncbi:MAG: hypothetical protein L6Q57_00015 [Alphaproteobacteria bacterium]|nr:hypothetical protein [Alphaproteobacteria bacterium]
MCIGGGGTSVYGCHQCIAKRCAILGSGAEVLCTFKEGKVTVWVRHLCGGKLEKPTLQDPRPKTTPPNDNKTPIKRDMPGERPFDIEKK